MILVYTRTRRAVARAPNALRPSGTRARHLIDHARAFRPAGADLAEGTIWPRRARVTLWSSVGENYAKMNEGEDPELGR